MRWNPVPSWRNRDPAGRAPQARPDVRADMMVIIFD
jgi:hypothetical protein